MRVRTTAATAFWNDAVEAAAGVMPMKATGNENGMLAHTPAAMARPAI